MIVFDVVVDGEVKETIKPANQRLKEIYAYVQLESRRVQAKYSGSIYLNRRMEYK
ncbi:mechanosensitive ion channel protein MscL [Paenibacillus sp. NEAU-GSW1]|uniref:mechanosensitive ion channel protein MscL n=1 Tax=Paenibacillus sp. NEAU-GSW1 TaxID=2682486 RepID=UPI0012E206C3|nr:mechanosensitive ion channel protein MscL [Paenibacillus sp. NEAU-GSW1]MUT68646.1 mechanosensitive ion channel protein MscL [Paenibacillus sp. NEAU-GSW1]